MNWKIFLYRTQVSTILPFEILVDLIKRKSKTGDKFKLGTVSKQSFRAYYAYRQGLTERLGFYSGPTNEIIITQGLTENREVIIDFKFPKMVLIAFGLIAVSIIALGQFAIPDLGLIGSAVVILTIYFWGVIRLNSQFYYFKSDLEQIEENYKKQVDKNI